MATAGTPDDPAPHLQPHRWTPERAREAGKKSAQVRRARKAATAKNAAQLSAHLGAVRATFEGADLVESISAVLVVVLARVAAGEIPVRHAGDAAELVRALHEVARLETGQPTAIRADVKVDASVALDRLAALQQTARATLGALDAGTSATVSAADDAGPDDEEHQGDEVVADAPPVEVVEVVADPPATDTESLPEA